MDHKKSRREFVKYGITTGLATPLLLSGLYSCNTVEKEKENTPSGPENKPLKILILGGTSFLGPHQIAYAMERGHSISTFTRGKTKPTIHQELFENVEPLVGDRKDNLTALENRKWDAVIDNSGRDPQWTHDTAKLLKENCDLYLYTSSTGVYYPYLDSDYKEDSEVVLEEPEGLTEEEGKIEYWFGVMKANSELEAIQEFGRDRTIVVRPTYMMGPADKTNRFVHWPLRLGKGGEVMVPGKNEDMVQYIDVRDVAGWMIRLIENKTAGTFNAVGPKEEQNMTSFVEEAQKAFSVDTSLVQVDDYDFLNEYNIQYLLPWIMPIENNAGSAKINNAKAIGNGLTFTPLPKTIKDTYNWWNSDAVTQERRDEVMSDPNTVLARESAILETWKKLQKA